MPHPDPADRKEIDGGDEVDVFFVHDPDDLASVVVLSDHLHDGGLNVLVPRLAFAEDSKLDQYVKALMQARVVAVALSESSLPRVEELASIIPSILCVRIQRVEIPAFVNASNVVDAIDAGQMEGVSDKIREIVRNSTKLHLSESAAKTVLQVFDLLGGDARPIDRPVVTVTMGDDVTVCAHGTVITMGGRSATITLGFGPYSKLSFTFEFHSDSGAKRQPRLATRLESDSFVIESWNFDSILGAGTARPMVVGESSNHKLLLNFRVIATSGTGDRVISYTFYQTRRDFNA